MDESACHMPMPYVHKEEENAATFSVHGIKWRLTLKAIVLLFANLGK